MSINDATPSQWDRASASLDPVDPVEKPQHYRVGEVEAIDYIAQQLGVGVKDYLLGNVHKYLERVQLQGSEVEAYTAVKQALRQIAGGAQEPEEESVDE